MIKSRLLSLYTFILLPFLSCTQKELCTITSWEGTYMGDMICDGVIDPDVWVTATLSFEGLINVDLGEYFRLELRPDECELTNTQRAAFINDYTDSAFTIELKNDQILWDYTITQNELTSVCQGTFNRQ